MTTKEPQYQECVTLQAQRGLNQLGLMSSHTWQKDPKRLTFLLSRYKFVAKMMRGFGNVLEIGCADAFASRIVQQEVGQFTAVDFDPIFIEDARIRADPQWPMTLLVHDILAGPVPSLFEGIFALDVFEHIAIDQEDCFLRNIRASLTPHGVVIIGTPSLQSQGYASPESRLGHVNCKDGQVLQELLRGYFHNVFLFSMNDEVVHTGFHVMAHYLFVLCCGPK